MSYYAEAVDSVLTDRWTSTSDIAAQIPYTYINSETHLRYVYRHLAKLKRWRVAEK